MEQQPRPVQRVAGDLAVFTGLSSEKAHQGTVSVSVQISSATTTNLCYDIVVDIVADSKLVLHQLSSVFVLDAGASI